jgi:hypothetical protein
VQGDTEPRSTAPGGEILFIVEEAPEGGFTARAAAEAIFTEADSWEELREAIRDAVHCHFEEGRQPAAIRVHRVQQEVFAT